MRAMLQVQGPRVALVVARSAVLVARAPLLFFFAVVVVVVIVEEGEARELGDEHVPRRAPRREPLRRRIRRRCRERVVDPRQGSVMRAAVVLVVNVRAAGVVLIVVCAETEECRSEGVPLVAIARLEG